MGESRLLQTLARLSQIERDDLLLCPECRTYVTASPGELCATCVRELPWWHLWLDERADEEEAKAREACG